MSLVAAVKERVKRRLGVPSVERSLEALRDRGFAPATVFDVGAYHGEFARFCRAEFRPAPQVFCFEPLAAAVDKLTPLAAAGEITLLPGLVGAEDAEAVPFHEHETTSSVLSHAGRVGAASAQPMRRLDTLIRGGQLPGPPDLLKIDTQGYELHVLRGIEGHLGGVRVILAEVNLLDIYAGVPLMHEVVGWLAARGWVVYDVCSLIRRPHDGAVWQSDLIFVQAGDLLRADKRWG